MKQDKPSLLFKKKQSSGCLSLVLDKKTEQNENHKLEVIKHTTTGDQLVHFKQGRYLSKKAEKLDH